MISLINSNQIYRFFFICHQLNQKDIGIKSATLKKDIIFFIRNEYKILVEILLIEAFYQSLTTYAEVGKGNLMVF